MKTIAFLFFLLLAATPLAAREVSIPLTAEADRIAVLEDKGKPVALVGLLSEQTLLVLDLTTQKELYRVALGFEPLIVVADAKSNRAYVGGLNHPKIAVIDTQKFVLIDEIDLGAGVYDLALSSPRQILLATHPTQRRLSQIDLKTRIPRVIELPQPALACAIHEPTGNILATLNSGPLGLLLLDGTNGEQIARLPSGTGTEDLVLDTLRNRAILLNSGSEDLMLVPLDLTSRPQTLSLDWKPTRLALSPDGQTAYLTSRDSDRLQVLDLTTGKVLRTQSIGRQPTGINLLPDGSLLIVEAGAKKLLWQIPEGLALSFTKSTPALSTKGAITGIVKDLAGRPVARGTLIVKGRAIPILPDGSFLISQLSPGRYEAQIQSPGYPDLRVNLQARAGKVATMADLQLPPPVNFNKATGIGFLADTPLYSDLLARQLIEKSTPIYKDRPLLLLNGPLGPLPEFEQFAPLFDRLTLLDRDGRYGSDLVKLQAMGRTLNLRYLVFTQVQYSRGYDTTGNALLNLIPKLFIPFFPFEIPNFSPNQLRSQGVAIVLDLTTAKVGDPAVLFQSTAQDETGGAPLYEEAADGLFRQEIIRLASNILQQWQEKTVFTAPP